MPVLGACCFGWWYSVFCWSPPLKQGTTAASVHPAVQTMQAVVPVHLAGQAVPVQATPVVQPVDQVQVQAVPVHPREQMLEAKMEKLSALAARLRPGAAGNTDVADQLKLVEDTLASLAAEQMAILC